METQTQETVVNASVDAGQEQEIQTTGTTEQTSTNTGEKVVDTAVDAQKPDEKVGEAIKREVERREAKLKQDYEQQVKTAAQQARDAYIAEQGYTWNGKPIATEAEYKQAAREQEIIEELQAKKLPDEVIKEMVENRNFREQFKQKEKESAAEAQRRADFEQFLQAFPEAKGEDIPQTVWDDVAKGTRLVDAYTRHENQLLKQKLAEVEQAKQIEQQNQENAASSTGSITGKAGDGPTSFTREQVEKMSEAEVSKNYPAIVASMKKW